VPAGPQWIYEVKQDGFRFVCCRDGARVRVFSRRGHDWTDRVPRIVDALLALPVESIVIDGEGVVCGADGIADFDALRAAVGRKGSRRAFLYAFDVLSVDGEDFRAKRWDARRDTLIALLREAGDGMMLSEHIDGADGAKVYQQACPWGWRASSPSGAIGRSDQAELLIGLRSGIRKRQR
jgi:bifunctional non-homologous end joining protein LigD